MKVHSTPWCEGDPDRARLIIVGEAPSFVEQSAHRPFVGPAGKVLDSCLHRAGIARTECYIVNIFSQSIKKDRNTKPHDMFEIPEDDYYRLLEDFKRFPADAVIIPMGATAMHLLCNQDKVLKCRGSAYHSTFEHFTNWVIPTIHPAATLRGQPLWQYFIISDLKKAKRWSLGNGSIPNHRFTLEPTLEESLEYLDFLQTQEQFAWDIEVWNNQVSCVSFAHSPTEAISIPFVDMDRQNRSYFTPSEEIKVWQAIDRLLSNPNITKIGQNLMFDASWLFHFHHILMQGPVKDTMLAHHIMYPDFPKGLDFLCSIYTDMPYYKEDRKLWKNWKGQQIKFWEYNARDSVCTFEVWNAIEEELKDYQQTYDMTLDLFYPLIFLIEQGMHVDKQALADTKVEITAKIHSLMAQLHEVSEWEFNPASPKQCLEYFYVTKGIKPYVSRTTGKPSCDDKAMQRLATTHRLKEASLVQEIRRLNKLLGTYVDVTLDEDSILRCFYDPRGTWGGRLSSSKTLWGTGLNMQNLHPAFKYFICTEDPSDEQTSE